MQPAQGKWHAQHFFTRIILQWLIRYNKQRSDLPIVRQAAFLFKLHIAASVLLPLLEVKRIIQNPYSTNRIAERFYLFAVFVLYTVFVISVSKRYRWILSNCYTIYFSCLNLIHNLFDVLYRIFGQYQKSSPKAYRLVSIKFKANIKCAITIP